MTTQPHSMPAPARSLFHETGLIYFWCLNDPCEPDRMDEAARKFAQAGVAAVCLHPRPGLLLPYGGDDWFDLIRRTTLRCAELGLDVWLYDEDPYPSGACGGWITAEHPQWSARTIEMFEADPTTCKDGLFGFPIGNLLWCGIVDQAGNVVEDLTRRVGMVRRQWSLLDPWDSRWYYPATPLYPCPRSDATGPEFAVRLPRLSVGQRLRAFVARPYGDAGPWGALPDSLNRDCTQAFIARTHERYRETVGDLFGSAIKAMFTDEPKYYGQRPWTTGMVDRFERTFGYDLRPRLGDLFSTDDGDRASLTRLHYRQWCGQRFEQAWLQPVARWCCEHGLPLVGHISPEDDPVEQSNSVSNLFPLQKHFDLPGLDLIIPAVGDQEHPLINIGVTTAVSVAAQQGRAGVMSETLGASGLDLTGETARRVLLWQAMMGVTTPVIHGGFNSVEGMRRLDAPPDSGPFSALWPDMLNIADELRIVQEVTRGSRSIAPAAIIWPIRSFNMQSAEWQAEPGGLRGDLVELLRLCLDNQVGTHLLDEQDLWDAEIQDGEIRVGDAAYTHVLIPSCTVLHARTISSLRAAIGIGAAVTLAGQTPTRQHSGPELQPLDMNWCPSQSVTDAVASLPRLIEIDGDATDVRCTAWQRDGRVTRLLMNLRTKEFFGTIRGRSLRLEPVEVRVLNK